MKLLLDTHIVLWALLDDPRLPAPLRDAITGAQALYISSVSVWEVSIKAGLGKLEVPRDLFSRALAAGAQPLPITWEHARAVQDLPPHHADPFDRLLIAQALCEGLTLVSVDRMVRGYDVPLLAG